MFQPFLRFYGFVIPIGVYLFRSVFQPFLRFYLLEYARVVGMEVDVSTLLEILRR